ncbi:MAG: efflux RND transporter periplasmic adaptor subunit, partial [Acidobacteria bacterium]|nr:efflux RND transporter periplasmic adaptor subunit [Acidobacteriota bacterium]
TLGEVTGKREALVFAGSDLPREAYSHLNVRRTLVSLAAIPMIVDERMIGALEVLSFEEPISDATLSALADLGAFSALGLASSIAYENERNTQLQSITRITQMYDLEKVFNATLEMDQLLPVITAKFQDILNVQTVNLWMVEGDGLLLMSRTGIDPAFELQARQSGSESIASAVADSGEAVVIDSPEDERLQKRNAKVEEGAAFSLMAAPILHQGAVVGVVEAINKLDGTPFDEDDLFLLSTMCETASNALHNASLLQAERKLEILETLVKVSAEITATLDLDRVLNAVVSEPAAVIPYERASIALEQRGRLQVRAVTGMTAINPSNPEVVRLQEILQWASLAQAPILVTQHGDHIGTDREETRAKFQDYFSQTGMRAFHAVPLVDDDGRLGVLAFESSDPDFLTTAHLEMIKVLSGQATVALRNASLYREVPFINVLQPVLEKKRRFMALEQRRRATLLAMAGAVVLFLAVFPLPMRVVGDATVRSAHRASIQPEVEGVVAKVLVREGDAVRRGTILAEMEDWPYRTALASAQAKYRTALSEMNRALAANDGAEAGIQRVQAEFWTAELERARERLQRTHLRSPIDGVVATPHVENLVGRHLQPGDPFAEVVDTSRASVDVAIEEQDVALLEAGEEASVKLEGFPTRTFKGQVTVVSPKSEVSGDTRYFYARVDVANEEGRIRAGMQGRAKVWVGWRQAGYVLLRRPAMWLWSLLWSWLGW